MPTVLTEISEVVTALGTLAPDLATGLAERPGRLLNVPDAVWDRIATAHGAREHAATFESAFANGAAFLRAEDGLRRRHPKLVEWKGPHRPPGDDVIPADIRIDHVYQVSCKYLSKITQNPGPARLFDRLLTGEQRAGLDWFDVVAPVEYQTFYESVRDYLGRDLPELVTDLGIADRAALKEHLRLRVLPDALQPSWRALCTAVSEASTARWSHNLTDLRSKVRLLWRLLRIGDAPYFVLGAAGDSHLRLRVASAWDWTQAFDLRNLVVTPRESGQPEVGWSAVVRTRSSRVEVEIRGHIEIRWSHGRFQGAPEAKVYLDTPHSEVPGFFPLV